MEIFDFICSELNRIVPFANSVGVRVDSVGDGRGCASLATNPNCGNHVGTIHAGALFTLAESASGAAMSGTFAEKILEVLPVARSASINYRRPANGDLTAKATVRGASSELLETLVKDGRVDFAIDVVVSNKEGEAVAEVVVEWNVRLK